jgi:hypothetical protein
MRPRYRAALALLLTLATSLAHAGSIATCGATQTLVPITFRFQDDPMTQAAWVLASLRPTLVLEQRGLSPETTEIRDGTLILRFCAPTAQISDRFTLTIGPRSLLLAARPIAKASDGSGQMAEISLLDQPRPNWVIVKSIERLTRPSGGLPSFDVELFNFGTDHPGGRVQYTAGSHRFSCMFGQPGQRVTVQVSLSGQRLRIASSDPEYPEEMIERPAEVRSGYCGSNFDVTADFGTTGRLPSGPTRIRYTLRATGAAKSDPAKTAPMASPLGLPGLSGVAVLGGYFPADGYRIKIVGEGIWP